MGENVIEVNKVSKVFSRNYKSARHQLKQMFKENLFGCKDKSKLNKNEFWALKGINFSVKRNEKLAILGPNGSGKSTLLKMLNGIFMPDEGEIKIDGNISSILELSTGFKPQLTGLENIYLKFSLMGKTKQQVDEVLESVIDFSELREFMDTPLKHYSSGMKSKLGFAIVTNLDPEILILDEVFAAGDKSFRKKSEKRIKELYTNTTTILVTHNMGIVKDIADRVIVIKKGELVFDGDVEGGIKHYQEMMSTKELNTVLKKSRVIGANKFTVVSAVYNVEKYLDEYFKSITKQSLDFEKHIKLILVDDGSTDNSAAIIKTWQQKFSNNIMYIKQENSGPSSARNKGMKYVKNPWVTFIDADDMINNTYFEEVDKCLVENKDIDIVSCNQIFYMDETKELKKHYLGYRFKNDMKVVNPSNMQGFIQATVNSIVIKTNYLKEHNSQFNTNIKPVFEDGNFINSIFIESKYVNIAFLQKPVYYYRKRIEKTSLVDNAWINKERYLGAIEYGLLDLFFKAKEKHSYIPIYLQRFVLYQIQYYYKRIINDKDKLDFLSQEELDYFKNLLHTLFSYIDSDTIEVCALGGLWHKYRIGFYNLYKDQIIFKQVCYIDGYDKLNKELKVHYYYHSDTEEIFLLNGKKIQPGTEEIIEHDFLGEVFVYEKIIYIPLVESWEFLDIKLGNVETQISLNAKRYKNGIQVNDFIKVAIKDGL